MSAVHQVFPKNQVDGGRRSEGGSEGGNVEGSGIYNAGNYLPTLSNDGREGERGDNPNQDAANVFAALGAPTDEFEAFVDGVTRLPERLERPIGTRATNAALWGGWSEFVDDDFFAESRRIGWGDYREYHRAGDKFLSMNGKPITFAPDDIGIRFDTPYELAQEYTTVTEEDYEAVFFNHREAHVNTGNPRKDRLAMYNLGGMSLGSDSV